MHLGHKQLFEQLDQNGAIVVILTGYANLTPSNTRQNYTNFPLFYYPLENIKHLEAREFINLLKEEFPKLSRIVVGYDFKFGNKAAYTVDDLKNLFDKDVVIVDEFLYKNISVHSRVIREYLRNGKIELANEMLGHNYTIQGLQIQGQGLGKKQFVPTINIEVLDQYLIPSEGIYITKTIIHSFKYDSISFVGHRKTTDNKFAVETHILKDDFSIIDSKNLSIAFLSKLRENQKYEHYEDLKIQILKDIELAKKYFS